MATEVPNKRKLLNPEAAAAYLDGVITTSTLAKRRMKGIAPAFVRLGNRVFYEPAELDRWKESCRVQPNCSAA